MNNRRAFIKKAGLLATATGLSNSVFANAAAIQVVETNPDVMASANLAIVHRIL